jgi:hypothetical protein
MQTSAATTANTKEYSIVRLNKANLKDLARLHSAVYAPVPDDHYFKKYDTIYTGIENIGFIAYKDDTPIAYYGVIPCFIEFGDQKILAAQSADTMTHPEFRMKGMFMELADKTFELCRQSSIQLVFGFPNQNSYHGLLKLGWRETEKLDCFQIEVKSLPLKSIAKRNVRLQKIYHSYCRLVLKKYRSSLIGVANSVLGNFGGVHRSHEYFQYRTYSSTEIICIGHSRVWINYRSDLVIGDMEGLEEANFTFVLNELKQIARKLGIRRLWFQVSSGTKLHCLFNQCITPYPSFPVLFKDFGSPIPIEKIKFTFADIDIF